MDAKINSDHNFFTNILHKIITINIIKLFSFILMILFLYSCSVDIEEVKGKKKYHQWYTTNKFDLPIMSQIDRKDLFEFNMDIITNEIGRLYVSRDMERIKNMVRSRGFRLPFNPSFDRYSKNSKGEQTHTITRINIKVRNMYNEIWCFAQKKCDKHVYEYWLMREGSESGVPYARFYFFITKSETCESIREIAYSSDVFFDSYAVSDDCIIEFPDRKITSLYVYAYPNYFLESKKEEIKDILRNIKE